METKFSALQKSLNSSQCERLCVTGSREVQDLAFRGGWRGLPGQPVSVSLGCALNMLVMSITMRNCVEPHTAAAWLPGLRSEAILKLGEDTSNWCFDGSPELEKQFWPTLYGGRDAIRPSLARLLACDTHSAFRELRFHSETDVERLSNFDLSLGNKARAPRFTIDAHDLAERVQAICGAPLFTASALTSEWV